MYNKNAPITLDINSSFSRPQPSSNKYSSRPIQVSVFYSWMKLFIIIMLITQCKCFYLTTISQMIQASSNNHVIQDFQDFMKVSRDKSGQQRLGLFMDMLQKVELDQNKQKMQQDRKLKDQQIQLDLKLRISKKTKLQQMIQNENELNEKTIKQIIETPFSRLNKQKKMTKKYVTTIYPYKVYELHSLQNVTLNYFKQLLTKQQINQSTPADTVIVKQNTTQAEHEKKQKRDQKDKLNVTKQDKLIVQTSNIDNMSYWNQTEHGHKDLVLLSQAFLFIRIDKCVHKDACKLIQMLPYNFVIMSENTTQHLKFHKISPHNFVIESIKQIHTNQTINRKQIDGQDSNQTKQQQQQVLYITSVYDYTLNINNYLYLKLAQEAEQKKKKALQNITTLNPISNKQQVIKKEQKIFISYQSKILIQHKIFQIYSNQSSVWDMAYNGSSLRCVKFQKTPVSAAIRKHIQQHNNGPSSPDNQKDKTMSIPTNYKAFTSLLTNKSETLKQQTPQPSNETTIIYLNTITLVELNINLNQQNRNYITQFYSSEYQHATNNSKTNGTRRKNMIGLTKSNNFFIFFTHFLNSTCRVTRVFQAGLKRLQLLEQIIVNNRVNAGQEVDKMGRGKLDNALVYFVQANLANADQSQKEYLIGSLHIKEVGKEDQEKKLKVAKGSMRQCTFRVIQEKAKMGGSFNSSDIDQKTKQKLQKVDIYKLGSDFVAVCYYKIRSLQQSKSKSKKCQILHSNCKPFYNISLPDEEQVKLEWTYSEDDIEVKNSLIRLFLEPSTPNATTKVYLSLQVDKQNLLNQAYKSNFVRAHQFPIIYPNISQQSDLSEDYSKFITEDPQAIYSNKKETQSPQSLNQSSSNTTKMPPSSTFSSNTTQQNLTAEQNITQADISESQQAVLDKLENIENATFFNYKDYIDRDRYRYLYGSRLLQSKLKVMYSSRWTETVQQQQSNCRILWKNQGTDKKIIGIQFGSNSQVIKNDSNNNTNSQSTKNESQKVWSICRISIDTAHQNLVLQPSQQSILTHNSTLTHPYKIYRCSLHSSPYLLKCSYNEWQANRQSLLPASSKSILFIINNGQTYNLKLSDLNSIQMDKVAQSFFIMFVSLSALTFLFTCVIVCRPVLLYFCVWVGLAGGAQIGWRYPLNCFQLRLKLRRMRKMGLIKEISSKKHNQIEQDIEHDDCIFCLQPKQPGLKMIQVYCKHAYHKQCFEAWIKQESGQLSCPMCKRKINQQGLNNYMSLINAANWSSQQQLQQQL